MITIRPLQRWAAVGGVALVAVLTAGCGTGSAAPTTTAVPARDGSCVARSVTAATCDHVDAVVRPDAAPDLSAWVGRTFGRPGALERYDVHDCSLPAGGPVGLVCTFWPGAPPSAMTDLVHRLDDTHLFTTVEVSTPGDLSGSQ